MAKTEAPFAILPTTLEPLTGEVNNIDYLVRMAPVSGWDILGSK